MGLVFLAALLVPACITDEPDSPTEVIRIENTTISYFNEQGDHWICKEALIYVDHKPRDVRFPKVYEGEIQSGTKIDWHCWDVKAYYKSGKRIPIDWEGTKE